MNIYQIAKKLNQMNVSTKMSCKWHPLTVKRILQNRAYTGVQHYGENRYRKVKGGKREITSRPKSEVITVEGFTSQLINPELYELVQEGQIWTAIPHDWVRQLLEVRIPVCGFLHGRTLPLLPVPGNCAHIDGSCYLRRPLHSGRRLRGLYLEVDSRGPAEPGSAD